MIITTMPQIICPGFYNRNAFIFLLFICFWLSRVFTAVLRLPPVAAIRGSILVVLPIVVASHCRAHALGHSDFSTGDVQVQQFQLPGSRGRAQLSSGMLNLLGLGIEPMFSALPGGFLTTGSPGKSCITSRKSFCFPGGARGKESTCQCRRGKRCRFDPCVGKIPWRRNWQPTAVFLPGKFHGQKSLAGYSPWGCKELNTTEQLSAGSHLNIFIN